MITMLDPTLTRLDALVGEGTPVISVHPLQLESLDRAYPLEVRITAPITGADLPVVVLSHGFESSADGYAPLANFWASRGFVVVQPSHLDSHRYSIAVGDPLFATIWRERVRDLVRVVDHLDELEGSVPGLTGRMNSTRVAAVGHSWGGQSVQCLLGARVLDADGSLGEDLSDPRVSAGILLSTTGTGGDGLLPFAREYFSFMNPSFAELSTPTLVIAGANDKSRLSSRGPDWFTDVYRLSPGATDLLTLVGAEHLLGGIAGAGLAATADENPERVAVIQRVTTAYLRRILAGHSDGWRDVQSLLGSNGREGDSWGRIDSK